MGDLTVTMRAGVSQGPQVELVRSKVVEAYDRITVALEAGGAGAPEASVDLQPGTAEQVTFLMIWVDRADLYGDLLTYKMSDGTTDTAEVVLDDPHIYLGKGAISLLALDPKVLRITNAHPVDESNNVLIEILVGREAVP